MDEENVGPLAELLVDYKEAKKAAELAPDDDELKRAYRTKKKLYKQAKKSAGQTDTVELGDAVSQATHAHKVPKELRPPPGQREPRRLRMPRIGRSRPSHPIQCQAVHGRSREVPLL